MQKEVIDFDNPEVIEHSGVFARRETIEVSPTELYDALKTPEKFRATFVIKPYNPIDEAIIKEINETAFSETARILALDSTDYVTRAKELANMEVKLDEYKKPVPEKDMEEYQKLYVEYQTLKKHWDKSYGAGKRKRRTRELYDTMIKNIVSVKNLIIDGQPEPYTGEVTVETLFMVPSVIINWLDEEMQRKSGLSEVEILGL
jgi:hypothetical protein